MYTHTQWYESSPDHTCRMLRARAIRPGTFRLCIKWDSVIQFRVNDGKYRDIQNPQ